MELRHRSLVTQEVEVGCWTFFHLDLSKITTAPATFEMYAPPVDPLSKILARIPTHSCRLKSTCRCKLGVLE